jgi:hypothetical protein
MMQELEDDIAVMKAQPSYDEKRIDRASTISASLVRKSPEPRPAHVSKHERVKRNSAAIAKVKAQGLDEDAGDDDKARKSGDVASDIPGSVGPVSFHLHPHGEGVHDQLPRSPRSSDPNGRDIFHLPALPQLPTYTETPVMPLSSRRRDEVKG